MENWVFLNKDGQIIERQKCEIYARVMGYYRPVSHFNTWKKAEFYSRKYFDANTSLNSKFINNFNENCECACSQESEIDLNIGTLGLAC